MCLLLLLLIVVTSADVPVIVQFDGVNYELPANMRFYELKKVFGLQGGYIATNDEDGKIVSQDGELIQGGKLMVPTTAELRPSIEPMKQMFFDRVRFRERTGETRWAKTMRQYWDKRRSFMTQYFGRYVYFCNNMVHNHADSPEAFVNIRHPCGSEMAFLGRVGAEIESTYTYALGNITEHETNEGPLIIGARSSMDFEIKPVSLDRKQQKIRRYKRVDDMLIDTGAEEINLSIEDFPIEQFTCAREVTNSGLYGSGYGRLVPIRAKLSLHSDYHPTWVILNDDAISMRLIGNRFLNLFYTMIAGPSRRWAVESSPAELCWHFLHPEEAGFMKNFYVEQKARESASQEQQPTKGQSPDEL